MAPSARVARARSGADNRDFPQRNSPRLVPANPSLPRRSSPGGDFGRRGCGFAGRFFGGGGMSRFFQMVSRHRCDLGASLVTIRGRIGLPACRVGRVDCSSGALRAPIRAFRGATGDNGGPARPSDPLHDRSWRDSFWLEVAGLTPGRLSDAGCIGRAAHDLKAEPMAARRPYQQRLWRLARLCRITRPRAFVVWRRGR